MLIQFLFILILNLLIQPRVLKGFLLGWLLGSEGEVNRRRRRKFFLFPLLTGPFG